MLLLTLCVVVACSAQAEERRVAEDSRSHVDGPHVDGPNVDGSTGEGRFPGISPGSASDYVAQGIAQFRGNEIAGSVRSFRRAVALAPQLEPRLWQLGICYYYAGEFQRGRQLFELHQQVNRNDVENVAWHFLCGARLDGVEAARKTLLEIDVARDVRVPMGEVHDLYAGRGTEAAVIAAAEKADTQLARMYAQLYLGLYYEVAGKPEQARSSMRKAAAARLENHYMHDVAKIHLLQRKWTP